MQRRSLPIVLIMVINLALLSSGQLQAQDATDQPSSSLSLELDPAPFLLNGYSFSLRYGSRALPHWSIMASIYASDFPDRMLSSTNRDAGWHDLRFDASQALFVDYSFREDGRGLFVGPSVFLYQNRVSHEPSGSELAFRSIYPNLRVGYTWFPFRTNGFYLCPWLNLGSEMAIEGTQIGDGPSYEVAGFKYIAAVHLGYRIGL